MTGRDPFPGLRPFEQHESDLYFGRDEQCDDLLSRLARRRLVAVVGMSGSGKSSLVRAGLIPALDSGYLPAAGSSWHVAVFRPGSDPLTNLTRALAGRRQPGGGSAGETPEAIRALLEASSLGLVAAARQLLTDPADCLLVVADQFEELFRFRRITRGARDDAAACVDLLVSASQQQDVPVYVVLTMRSDYLGDCAQFTGLPEALNDSQFLVPRMTRAQLREAIEDPIAVCGGRISPRLVQRLLYDVERRGSPDGALSGNWELREQDQLPVLQHALMRVWNISRAHGDGAEAIDLRLYEAPPIETLEHAIDRHAEEVYQALPTDAHRDVARLMFQQLTDRDAENREVRRPTPLRELTAVALRANVTGPAGHEALVNDVVAAFAAEGRAFLVINPQGDVDISHESFIRNWERLRKWLSQENRSRRIYTRLVEAAASWEQAQGSLYRGPELAVARRWWREERPTELWAGRYDDRFELAQRFLEKSTKSQRLRRGLLAGNAVILIVSAIAIALLMGISRDQARRAEASALEARNAIEESRKKLTEANEYFQKALEAEKKGQTALAETLAVLARNAEKQATTSSVLTRGELAELSRLRLESAARKNAESAARQNTERDRREIEQLVQQWARALTSGDVPTISNIRKFTREEAASWQRLYRNYKQIEVSVEVTGAPEVIEDQALVPVREIMIMTQNNGIKITGQPRDTHYRMQKVAGRWLMLAPDAPMPKRPAPE
jgi:energy-coupling factor transporter ATP-binding protein EcfA2